MFGNIPSAIQPPALPEGATTLPWDEKVTPLLLIHDGGGTTFSYYCLGDLGRLVYGIANPRYHSGVAWEGGIPEMARHYIDMLKMGLPRSGGTKKVILGGWSLGGMIALEMARQLAANENAGLSVVGVAMIDTPCPFAPLPAPAPRVVQHVVEWSPLTREDTKRKVQRCFAEGLRMLGQWTLPEWADAAQQDGACEKEGPHPPPVVLLRATGMVPVVEPGVARIDIHRSDPQLGWGQYRKQLVRKVIDIPGNHYNLFNMVDNLEVVTSAIRQACAELEALAAM
ncbi:hypothetical protein VTJ83DRAFT_3349 [Remersonia thermophila]|uniref:Thioesterase domain-containing protein n=1 Tax=Remersonia thermophila TaxID=72144 RepID=A0ABR4DDS2_9PEZI